jgi:hypothetical protein
MNDVPLIFGIMGEFDSADGVLAAARALHAAGFTRMEAYTPFMVEGLAEVTGMKKTRVPLATLIGAALGATTGFGMCWYANVISYPWNIGGRPHNSWPAWIPLTFELGVLGAALVGTITMLAANGLPRLHHPVFDMPGFERSSIDRFFVCVEAEDPRFDIGQLRRMLHEFGATAVAEVGGEEGGSV